MFRLKCHCTSVAGGLLFFGGSVFFSLILPRLTIDERGDIRSVIAKLNLSRLKGFRFADQLFSFSERETRFFHLVGLYIWKLYQ